jgi:sugar/nucleoside kinase (ribokinase family)
MTALDFLVIGHVVKDVSDGGWRLGGTVTYAATQASRLGLRTGVVTTASPEIDLQAFLPDVSVHCIPSELTTTFANRYAEGRRVQHVWAKGSPIEAEDVPPGWRNARIVLLGPVLDEVSVDLANIFDKALVGFCAQGRLREVRPDGLVVRRRWRASESVRGVDVVVVSDEDIEDDEGVLERWQQETSIIVVTEGKGGARVYNDGRWRKIGAFPHDEVDPTGAGDVFAAAFVIALDEARSVDAAARFAVAAAGLSIEAAGTASVATRQDIERVLAEHAEVVLE